MGKRYLCSDLSEEESYFITQGLPLIGTGNPIADLFKFIGKYEDLKGNNREEEIINYRPQNDFFFKYENLGYTIIGNEIEKTQNHRISRKYLKNISRKWSPSRVKLSFDTPIIISVLYSYIMAREILKTACINYFSYDSDNWQNIMPIQFEFLGVRFRDHRKNWKVAQKIIHDICSQTLH